MTALQGTDRHGRFPRIHPRVYGKIPAMSAPAPASITALKAAHPDVELWVSEREHGLVLNLIRTPAEQRSQGLAARAFTDLLAYADTNALIVALTPAGVPSGKGMLSDRQLRAWYTRHGFRPNTGRSRDHRFNEALIREPGAST